MAGGAVGYAAALSNEVDKGDCGGPELFEAEADVEEKVMQFARSSLTWPVFSACCHAGLYHIQYHTAPSVLLSMQGS